MLLLNLMTAMRLNKGGAGQTKGCVTAVMVLKKRLTAGTFFNRLTASRSVT